MGTTHPFKIIIHEKLKELKQIYKGNVPSIDDLYEMVKGKLTRMRYLCTHGNKSKKPKEIVDGDFDHFTIERFEERRRAIVRTQRKNRIEILTKKYGIFQTFENVIFNIKNLGVIGII